MSLIGYILNMQAILASKVFQIIGVPLIFIIIGVYTNRLGRRDGYKAPMLNDWSVGTITLLTALGGIISDLTSQSITRSQDISSFGGWLTAVFLALFISIDNDRFRSWERDDKGLPTNRKNLLWGVVFPIMLSSGLFIAYQYNKLAN